MKKSYGHICKEKLDTVYNFIKDNKDNYSVKLMCNIFNIPRSSFYKSLTITESMRSIKNKQIQAHILKIYKDSKKRYGAIKINYKLRQININISLKRTQRLMKKLGIKSVVCKKFRPFPSKSKVEEKKNILKRDFNASRINQKWCTDITYIHTIKDGWCYLASVMDLYSRKIIGYSFSKSMDSKLAINAVDNALNLQKPVKPLVLHSDLGVQYTSCEFENYLLGTHLLTHSFSAKGCPYDNACIESFHASLKKEEVNLVKYYDYNSAKLAVFQYIESWYNRIRIHGSIGYITPQQCEDNCKKYA
ncbi:IS3 family transposase [Clostridium tyrobutyricum]|uniref:IS3 family transposase n=1 Tax=Clostridium tyrobutyricum TaxID=1519 RepID=UPI001C38CCE3|nr:IS3 family transposase [Clostridium tyrobutyricum]MBV4432801.1 IS3 family transposase [Clostridium tyrobutyricum]MBV4444961.1 IS3 family transposase [Clostridium tyrobutyricum]